MLACNSPRHGRSNHRPSDAGTTLPMTETRMANPHRLPRLGPEPGSGRALCLVLLALAWFQLAWASHQFEHVAGDPAGPCVVCAQLDRLDAVAAEQPAEAAGAASGPAAPFEPVLEHPRAPVRSYRTRAPPAA